nr:MAG TPA: hypothetical protein [Caudoviricetes sp.]
MSLPRMVAIRLSNTSQRYLKKALQNSMNGTQKGCCR